jgi:membrane protein implicated in regulation of membrane protease activity
MRISRRFSIIIFTMLAIIIILLCIIVTGDWPFPIETILWMATLILGTIYLALIIRTYNKRGSPTQTPTSQ